MQIFLLKQLNQAYYQYRNVHVGLRRLVRHLEGTERDG